MPAHGAATFTRITQPSGGTTFLDKGGSPTMHVAGRTSSDVTAVDVYCMGGSPGDVVTTPVATDVGVTGGSFSLTVPVPHAQIPVCRLRALPNGTNLNAQVSAFAGPIVHLDRLTRLTQGSSTFDFDLTAGSGDGAMELKSAATAGTH